MNWLDKLPSNVRCFVMMRPALDLGSIRVCRIQSASRVVLENAPGLTLKRFRRDFVAEVKRCVEPGQRAVFFFPPPRKISLRSKNPGITPELRAYLNPDMTVRPRLICLALIYTKL